MIVNAGGPPPGIGFSSSEPPSLSYPSLSYPSLSYPIENAPTEQRQCT
ncbi:MAG: hypothetical protein L0H78_23265 [Humibacillus sp.]|nr:hypothetical protein [Humibacillus sp.]